MKNLYKLCYFTLSLLWSVDACFLGLHLLLQSQVQDPLPVGCMASLWKTGKPQSLKILNTCNYCKVILSQEWMYRAVFYWRQKPVLVFFWSSVKKKRLSFPCGWHKSLSALHYLVWTLGDVIYPTLSLRISALHFFKIHPLKIKCLCVSVEGKHWLSQTGLACQQAV